MRRFDVLDAFRYPTFRLVWSAGFVSQLGDWMQIVGRATLAYQVTGSASALGVVYFASYLPQLLFSIWGGVLADRFNRRRLLVGTQIAEAAGAVAFGVLAATGTATLWSISLLSFFIGFALMLNIPVQQALTPAVVPKDALSSAINLSTATNSVTRVFGPLIAGVMIVSVGIQWVFWVNAATFAFVIVAWAIVKLPEQEPIEESRNLDAIMRALRYVRDTPSVAVPIAVTSFLMIVGVLYQPFAVVYATKVLAGGQKHLGDRYYSWLQAAIGMGAAIGVLMSAGIGRRRPAITFTVTALGFGLLLALLGRVDSFGLALVVLVFTGAFHFANMSLGLNLVQHEVPDVLRGRVMSIQMLGLIGMIPISSLVGGWFIARFGIQQVFAAAGTLCFLFSLLLLRWKRYIRELEVEPESPETVAAVGRLVEEEV